LIRHLPLLALLFSPAAPALSPPTPFSATGAQVSFAYRVTLIPVRGTAHALSAATSLDFARLDATRATVRVDLASLKTGIALRDRHAREALGAAEYPGAVFTLNRYQGPASIAPGQTIKGEVSGTFLLRGVARPVTAPVTLTRQGERLNVQTRFTLQPRDHGVNVRGADQTTTVTASFTLAARP
jgi:polyisoprenoid-binding protein YceI